MAKLRFHDLTISAVRVDTASSVELSFDIPPALASDFVFEPGQYLTLGCGGWAGLTAILFNLLSSGRTAAFGWDQTDRRRRIFQFCFGPEAGGCAAGYATAGAVHGADWWAAQLFALGCRFRRHADQIDCAIRVGGRSR